VCDRRQRIEGEVYDVDDQMLAFMDHFEGHPEVYSRDKVRAHSLGPPYTDDDSFECWTYFLKVFPPALLCKETTSVYDGYSSKPYQPESVSCFWLIFHPPFAELSARTVTDLCYSNTTVYYGIHERSLIHDRRSCVYFTLGSRGERGSMCPLKRERVRRERDSGL